MFKISPCSFYYLPKIVDASSTHVFGTSTSFLAGFATASTRSVLASEKRADAVVSGPTGEWKFNWWLQEPNTDRWTASCQTTAEVSPCSEHALNAQSVFVASVCPQRAASCAGLESQGWRLHPTTQPAVGQSWDAGKTIDMEYSGRVDWLA